eukprot:jgi/Botrbrau1/12594/Bobra.0169s0122.1
MKSMRGVSFKKHSRLSRVSQKFVSDAHTDQNRHTRKRLKKLQGFNDEGSRPATPPSFDCKPLPGQESASLAEELPHSIEACCSAHGAYQQQTKPKVVAKGTGHPLVKLPKRKKRIPRSQLIVPASPAPLGLAKPASHSRLMQLTKMLQKHGQDHLRKRALLDWLAKLLDRIAVKEKNPKRLAMIYRTTQILQKPDRKGLKAIQVQKCLQELLSGMADEGLEQAAPTRADQQPLSVLVSPPLKPPDPVEACPSTPAISQRARHSIQGKDLLSDPAELMKREERNARFNCMMTASLRPSATLREARRESCEEVYGTSQALEKEYLRLTTLPTVDKVRPPEVLERALHRVKHRWLQEHNYPYACEQLKSIRQDLTVQQVRGALAVEVYETHARIALESSDLPEFNQCQTALRDLHEDPSAKDPNVMEFRCYGLLYTALMNPQQLASALRDLPVEALKHDFICHALKVCKATREGNPVQLVRLFKDAPRMAPCIMNFLLEKVRVAALRAWKPTYQGHLPLAALATRLGYDSNREAGEFAESNGATVDWDNGMFLCNRPACKTSLLPAKRPAGHT